MLYSGGNVNGVAGQKDLCLFTPFLIIPFSCNADKYLTAALFGIVNMPVVPAAGLKGDIENTDLTF